MKDRYIVLNVKGTKIRYITAIILLLSASVVLAQGDAGRESSFSLGAGARGMAMGRAFVSLSGDASAAFCNPAATAAIDRTEFSAFHTSLFMGTNYDCIALSHPVGMLGVFSLSAGRIGTGDIVSRDDFNRPGETISAADLMMGVSYARSIGHGLATGLTIKGIGLEIGDNAGYGFGLDLGFQYQPRFLQGLRLGAGFNDLIQPRIKLLSSEDKYQTVSRAGLSYSRDFHEDIGVTGVVEFEKIVGRDNLLHPGLELALYDDFALRAGVDHDRMTFGGGLAYNIFKIDYAFENKENLGGSHRVSFGIAFGKSVKNARDEYVNRAIETEKASWQKSIDDQRKSEFSDYLSRGDSLGAASQYQDALIYYQRALVIDENSDKARLMSDSMMNIIISMASSKARDQKREDLTTKRIEMALEDMKAGRFNQAVSNYELALEIDPANSAVAELLTSAKATRAAESKNIRRKAQNYMKAGEYSNAIGEWNRLLSLEPSDSEALRSIDISKVELRASDLLASAVRSMESGNYSQAAGYLDEAQRLKPNDKAVQSLLSEARAKSAPLTGLTDIKSNSDHWSVYLRGLGFYQSGEYQKALSDWESLRQFYPNNSDLESNISQARQRLATEGGE